MKTLTIIVNKGGKGSGDFGHKGIPGHQGGSAGGGVSSAKYGSRRDVALAITDGNIDLKSLNWQKQEKDRYASSGVDYWHADIGDGYSVTLTVTNGTSYGHIKNSRLRDERKTKHYVSASLSVHEQNVFSQFPVEKFSISKSVSGEGRDKDDKHHANVKRVKKFIADKYGIDVGNTLWTPDN